MENSLNPDRSHRLNSIISLGNEAFMPVPPGSETGKVPGKVKTYNRRSNGTGYMKGAGITGDEKKGSLHKRP